MHQVKVELYHDNFQNYKRYNIPKAQLVINVFRDLQNSYMRGMVPRCPRCKKPFDPTEISQYTNKKYCVYKKERKEE